MRVLMIRHTRRQWLQRCHGDVDDAMLPRAFKALRC